MKNFILLFILSVNLVLLQSQSWINYRTSNTSSTISNDDVFAIIADSDNNMWFGSDDGLTFFDGTNYSVYTSDNSDLPANHINDLEFDGEGNLWIAHDDGVSKFINGRFISYDYDDGMAAYYAECLEYNELTGDMWIGYGPYYGITRYDGSKFINYDLTDGLANEHVNTIATNNEGNIWCGFGK